MCLSKNQIDNLDQDCLLQLVDFDVFHHLPRKNRLVFPGYEHFYFMEKWPWHHQDFPFSLFWHLFPDDQFATVAFLGRFGSVDACKPDAVLLLVQQDSDRVAITSRAPLVSLAMVSALFLLVTSD